LPEVSPSSEGSETDPYYYVYDYEGVDVDEAKATTNYETYGVLYNWPAVMTEGICPSGWHIPSDGEFTQLTDFLGGEEVAGYAMKSTAGWDSGGNGSNSSGFNGLPGGHRESGSASGYVGQSQSGFFWTSLQVDTELFAWYRRVYATTSNVDWSYYYLQGGFSARCIKD
jgi:uncharacterized protein (TIGR02145 family)